MLNVTSCSVIRQRTDFCSWSSSAGERSARSARASFGARAAHRPRHGIRQTRSRAARARSAIRRTAKNRQPLGSVIRETRGGCHATSRHAAQIESERKVWIELRLPHGETARHVTHVVEAGDTSTFGGRRVDRSHFVGTSAGVNDVIRTTRDRPLIPAIVDVDMQRPVDADRRVEAGRRLPGTVTHAANPLPRNASGLQRQRVAVDRDQVASLGETKCPDL